MDLKKLARRQWLTVGGATALAGAAGVWFWPTGGEYAAYPFARRLAGKADPLWKIQPDKLELASADDAERLSRLVSKLDDAVHAIEREQHTIESAKVGELSEAERRNVRTLWWQAFEPMLAIDEIKHRYRGWYGIDYLRHPSLHARAFALGFVALCAQVDSGLRLLQVVAGRKLAQTLFDEAMPEFGLPARTFSALRGRLGRARDLFYVPVGAEWYERWLAKYLHGDVGVSRLRELLDRLRKSAVKRVLTPTKTGVQNKAELVQTELFQKWFPLQKGIAEWAGDTRVAKQERRLISDAQLAAMKTKLEPGDIILERRNWYVSNIGLPGFWPHAALYVGTQQELTRGLLGEPEVRAKLGDVAGELSRKYPRAWASLAEKDADGHEHCVIEAVSEGVVSASFEHSCGADYVAALRPRLSPLARAVAIQRALEFWGRPYDFNFDFATDDQLVCSELVVKAFESKPALCDGLQIPHIEIARHRAVPPTEIVRLFARERGSASAQLEFVYFLDGVEKQRTAIVANADALAASAERPKWDIIQP